MRFCILQDFAASEVRLCCGVAPIRFGFGFCLEAERLKDECRIEVRGGPIKTDDEVNNSDADADADDGGFHAEDYPRYELDFDADFYRHHHTNAEYYGGYRKRK
ncbi:hypothetical protein LOK49_LG07G03151 [Camellia lanceoleosa]|uniref:Uncharacterized protein n=1 Tax=Camellia lanceoleosa TaxID=1840588 RepID=A0ACC0H000_9ERIC|nr:hypothetical protein LOK49_LG07G03151 [Camellia lanceoleosa]